MSSGEVAGAVYFDIGNKYIACVGVDENYRRRSLGTLLVLLAVAMCESSNALIHGGGVVVDDDASDDAGDDVHNDDGGGVFSGVSSVDETMMVAQHGSGRGGGDGREEDSVHTVKASIRYGGRARCFIQGARPNLCVSPKDLVTSPHLHRFYTKLGFMGGSEEKGGNYVLSEEAGRLLLEKYDPPSAVALSQSN
jgi:hypothetical protein